MCVCTLLINTLLSCSLVFFPRFPAGGFGRQCWPRFGGPGDSSGFEVRRDVSDEPTGEEQRSLECAAEISSEHAAGAVGRRYNTHFDHFNLREECL